MGDGVGDGVGLLVGDGVGAAVGNGVGLRVAGACPHLMYRPGLRFLPHLRWCKNVTVLSSVLMTLDGVHGATMNWNVPSYGPAHLPMAL